MTRLITLLCAVALVACGGSSDAGTNPPPPPLPPITRLVLADTSALVFTGSSVPGAAFVAHAYDATGAEVAHPVLTLAAGSGWAVRGDTLIAPSTEGRTTLRISATRAEPTTADWVHLSGATTDASAAATDSTTVTAGIDLRAYHWAVSFICRYPQPSSAHTGVDGGYLDSAAVRGAAIDSVVYASDSSWIPNLGGVAQLWGTGSAIWWHVDGTADTVAVKPHVVIWSQGPDTLYLGGLQYPSPVHQDSLRHYAQGGGYAALTICNDHSATLPDTLWFDETP